VDAFGNGVEGGFGEGLEAGLPEGLPVGNIGFELLNVRGTVALQ
jgi:hypothetical protein